jgi:hypothetical protein
LERGFPMGFQLTRGKLIVRAVSVLFVVSLLLQGSLAAKEKRGAQLVVTKLNGLDVEGELLSVREDALLLLGFAGLGQSVGLTEIESVRIVREDHAGSFVLGGFLAGAIGGVIYTDSTGEPGWDTLRKFLGGIYGGFLGVLAGFALSLPVGLDTKFAIAGEPEDVVRRRLEKLARMSREPSHLVVPTPAEMKPKPAPPERPSAPSVPSPAPPRPARRPRFKAEHKTVLSARAQAAYDFYFIPALSPGACIGYRHLEAKFPATSVSWSLEFVEEGVPYYEAERFTRSTEISIPERTFTRSTFYLAIRAGFRF